jgi:hypothetical protein
MNEARDENSRKWEVFRERRSEQRIGCEWCEMRRNRGNGRYSERGDANRGSVVNEVRDEKSREWEVLERGDPNRGSVVNGVNTRQRRRRKEDTSGLRTNPKLFVY